MRLSTRLAVLLLEIYLRFCDVAQSNAEIPAIVETEVRVTLETVEATEAAQKVVAVVAVETIAAAAIGAIPIMRI